MACTGAYFADEGTRSEVVYLYSNKMRCDMYHVTLKGDKIIGLKHYPYTGMSDVYNELKPPFSGKLLSRIQGALHQRKYPVLTPMTSSKMLGLPHPTNTLDGKREHRYRKRSRRRS